MSDCQHIGTSTQRRCILERSFRFPATADAPRLARQALDGWMNALVGAERADDARLLTSELISNAIRHGDVPSGGGLTVSVQADDSTLTIGVEQPTSAAPAQVVEPWDDRSGGYGLRLVDALADSWGVEEGVPGRVWFELPVGRAGDRTGSGYLA
jgi:anti-sigma regulatory factor (Ser/Thr protein kinase)